MRFGKLRPPAVPVEIARGMYAWLQTVAHKLADPGSVRLAMNSCTTTDEVRAVLAHRAIEPLRQQATAIGARAASQGAAMVAIIPSPALEGLAAGLRSLKLIREIASLYSSPRSERDRGIDAEGGSDGSERLWGE